MLAALLRQDLTLMLRERSLPLVLCIAVVAVVYATWSGSTWKAQQLIELDRAQQELSAGFTRESLQLERLESGELTLAEAAGAGLPNAVRTSLLQPPGPLAELAIGSADNAASLGPAAALTGPAARGDEATIDAHLAAIGERAPRELAAYEAMLSEARRLAAERMPDA